MTGQLLEPRFDTRAINGQKERQQQYYDRQTKQLKPIQAGEAVRMRLPGESSWTAGVCRGLVGPRSYRVEVGDQVYTRNRRHLISANSPAPPVMPDIEEPSNDTDTTERSRDTTPTTATPQQFPCNAERTAPSPSVSPPLRRSGRNRKPPDWFTTYVPS